MKTIAKTLYLAFATLFVAAIFNIDNAGAQTVRAVAAEYWIDQDFAGRQPVNVSPGAIVNIDQMLNTGDYPSGYHTLHFRVKDSRDAWSIVESRLFIAGGGPNATVDRMRYWVVDEEAAENDEFIGTFEDRAEIELDGGAPVVVVEDVLDLSSYPAGRYTMVAQFRQAGSGEWSETMLHDFSVCGVSEIIPGKSSVWREGPARPQGGCEAFVDTDPRTIATAHVRGFCLDDAESVTLVHSTSGDRVETKSMKYMPNIDALLVTFDLTEAELGAYDVEVVVAGATEVLDTAYKVLAGGVSHPLRAELIGDLRYRLGRALPVTLKVTNENNIDEYDVPVRFELPYRTEVELVGVEYRRLPQDAGFQIPPQSIPQFFIDDLNEPICNEDAGKCVWEIVVPHVPSESAASYKLRLTFPDQEAEETRVTVRALGPLQWNIDEIECYLEIYRDVLEMDLEMKQEFGECVCQTLGTSNVSLTEQAGDGAGSLLHTGLVGNTLNDFVTMGVSCAAHALGDSLFQAKYGDGEDNPYLVAAREFREELARVAIEPYDLDYLLCDSARRNPPYPIYEYEFTQVASFDPNMKAGPSTIGNAAVSGQKALEYAIFFENLEDATANAQVVRVTDQLDPEVYDLSSFAFRGYGWGDTIFYQPPGMTYDSAYVDMRPEEDFLVKIISEFNPETGFAEWRFTTVDPQTLELTEDLFAGFLPPNDPETGSGEGYVTFAVKVKEDLPQGRAVRNKATIYFDNNAPIETNTWQNTIDFLSPESEVVNAEVIGSGHDRIVLHWEGEDDPVGTGIRSYAIYYAINGGPYELWQANLTGLSDTMDYDGNNDYYFYSIATDFAGNVEAAPETEDLFLMHGSVDELDGARALAARAAPNPFGEQTSITFLLPSSAEVSAEIYNAQGERVAVFPAARYGAGRNEIKWDASRFAAGVYFFRLQTAQGVATGKLVKSR